MKGWQGCLAQNRPEAEHPKRGGRGTEGRARCVPTLVLRGHPWQDPGLACDTSIINRFNFHIK